MGRKRADVFKQIVKKKNGTFMCTVAILLTGFDCKIFFWVRVPTKMSFENKFLKLDLMERSKKIWSAGGGG